MIRSIRSIIIILVATVIALATAVCNMMRESHHARINRRQLAVSAMLWVVLVPMVWVAATLAK